MTKDELLAVREVLQRGLEDVSEAVVLDREDDALGEWCEEFQAAVAQAIEGLDQLDLAERQLDVFVYRTNNMFHELRALQVDLGQ